MSCTMINKLILAANKCAIFKIKLPYYLSFVNGFKIKTVRKCSNFANFYQTCKGTDFENVSEFSGG